MLAGEALDRDGPSRTTGPVPERALVQAPELGPAQERARGLAPVRALAQVLALVQAPARVPVLALGPARERAPRRPAVSALALPSSSWRRSR